MSSEERKKILQMVEEGKISAEEAAHLMRALEADQTGTEVEVLEAGSAPTFEETVSSADEFEEIKTRARRFAMIPLWIGVFVTILSAWGIYEIQQGIGTNYWWICLMFPLFLGILLVAIGAGGQGSHWIYINVDRRYSHDGPKNITVAFPLPLALTSWFLRNFGHHIQGLKKTNVDDVIQILDATRKSGDPFIVNVNDEEDGERVQVYIG